MQLGFKPTISDPSLFTFTNFKFVLHILIYVDDILITGSSSQAIKNLITTLNNSFSLKDLGCLHYFLGIEAHWTPDGSLLLSQTKYIHQLLQKANVVNVNSQPSPMVSSPKLTADGSTIFQDPTLFRQVVGALQYLTFTRPDITFVVNKVSQYMHNP